MSQGDAVGFSNPGFSIGPCAISDGGAKKSVTSTPNQAGKDTFGLGHEFITYLLIRSLNLKAIRPGMIFTWSTTFVAATATP